MLHDTSGSQDNPRPAGAQPAAKLGGDPKPRQIIVISDLHMGEGKDATTGLWYPTEDFRWPRQFAQFLKHIDREGAGATDLIINGDLFELWESRICACQSDRGEDYGCTEEEALIRLTSVLQAHKSELEALKKFATRGDNRLIIIPGNHDVALLFPKVREAALNAIGADARVSFVATGYWLSEDQLIYLEHGHQIGHEVNKWEQWPAPFLEKDGQRFLQRPWGEKFVQDYFNRFENKYPVIDNISSRNEGIYYALAAEGAGGTVKDVAGFLKFYLFQVSWRQLGASLGKKEAKPEWDLKAIRDKGSKFLVESLPSDHPLAAVIRDPNNTEVQQQLDELFKQLTDEDIKTICDQRALLAAEQDQKKIPRNISRCPEIRRLGAVVEAITSSKSKVLGKHFEEVASPAVNAAFKVFIYGHTHLAEAPRVLTLSSGYWRPVVVNSGAWQRVATPEQITAIKNKKNLPEAETLAHLVPEDLPPCYSYVCIKPYPKGENPQPQLLY